MFIAIIDNQSVFGLAMLAWLALACSFGPIITIYSFGGKMSQRLALITMFSGLYMMLIWHYLGFGSSLYEAAPGMILGFIPYLTKKIFCAKIVKK